MKKVKITISVNSIYFSFSNARVIENINETSYIETGNLLFEKEYLENNIKLMTSFLKDIINDTTIDTLKVKNIELVPIVLKITKNIKCLKKLYILDNSLVDISSFLTILDNNNLNYVNCYNMSGVMFNYLNKRKDIFIETRSIYRSSSPFTTDNKLNKYSSIYYKRTIVLASDLTAESLRDLEIFLCVNKSLQNIIIKEYNLDSIKKIISLVKMYQNQPVRISIHQNELNKDLIDKDLEQLKKLKSKRIKLKLTYDKSIILKNLAKQINLSVLKTSALVIIFSLFLILGITKYTAGKEDNETDEIINNINEIVDEYINEDVLENYEMEDFDDTLMVEQETAITKKTKSKNSYQVKYEQLFSKLLEINPHTVGWLTVKNTDVDYPVVQYTDNDYYLKHSFDNKENSRGWIFADYRNNFTSFDDNTIIYGHNLKSGYMFGTLQKVLDPSWYNNIDNRTIIFNTITDNYTWQIFSIYTIEKNNDYLVANFANSNNFNNYIKLSKERSIIDFGVNVKYKDKILTLSTCYKDSNHRLIIQAKLNK